MVSKVHPEILAQLSQKRFSVVVAEEFRARLAIICHFKVPVLKINLFEAQVIKLANETLEEEIEEEREDLVALDSVHV